MNENLNTAVQTESLPLCQLLIFPLLLSLYSKSSHARENFQSNYVYLKARDKRLVIPICIWLYFISMIPEKYILSIGIKALITLFINHSLFPSLLPTSHTALPPSAFQQQHEQPAPKRGTDSFQSIFNGCDSIDLCECCIPFAAASLDGTKIADNYTIFTISR